MAPEEPGMLQFMGPQTAGTTKRLSTQGRDSFKRGTSMVTEEPALRGPTLGLILCFALLNFLSIFYINEDRIWLYSQSSAGSYLYTK